MSNKTFLHGIHPAGGKDITAEKSTERLPLPPRLIILLSQHIGKPAKCCVSVGDELKRGQLIAEADGYFSAPIHSPVDGVVKSVAQALDQDGKLSPAIFIEPFPSQESIQPFLADPEILTRFSAEEIVRQIQKSGLVGLGGAAFPTHVKFSIPSDKHADVLLVNGSECEPYLTSDYRVMVENPDTVVLGTLLAMKAIHVDQAIIGIEDNKPAAVEAVSKALAGHPEIKLTVCQTKYPQGAEKIFIKTLTGREVPSGGLPIDVGVVCANVTTVSKIAELISDERNLVERVVTVTGDGVKNPGNYIVPIGTPLSFILEQIGLVGDTYEVLFGGPMMGKSVSYLGTPTTKGTTGIVVLTREELGGKITYNEINPCIRCGECLKVCPMHLNPSQLGRLGRKRHYNEMAEDYHLNDCFECGCCTYVCTACIPLVQQFRIAKQILRERGQK